MPGFPAATTPRRDKLGLITDGTHIVGLPDWIEQLVAESTGKEGTGILPVVLQPLSPEADVETSAKRPYLSKSGGCPVTQPASVSTAAAAGSARRIRRFIWSCS